MVGYILIMLMFIIILIAIPNYWQSQNRKQAKIEYIRRLSRDYPDYIYWVNWPAWGRRHNEKFLGFRRNVIYFVGGERIR